MDEEYIYELEDRKKRRTGYVKKHTSDPPRFPESGQDWIETLIKATIVFGILIGLLIYFG